MTDKKEEQKEYNIKLEIEVSSESFAIITISAGAEFIGRWFPVMSINHILDFQEHVENIERKCYTLIVVRMYILSTKKM